jgi:hypothetical protein
MKRDSCLAAGSVVLERRVLVPAALPRAEVFDDVSQCVHCFLGRGGYRWNRGRVHDGLRK